MFDALLARVPTRFVFVVGKGGVGKTTTAGAIALALADDNQSTRLISTDPAHSISDLFNRENCSSNLTLEEFDARTYADRFFAELRAPLIELIERGTYLDAADAASFLDLSIPGIDEVMGALRLVELYESDARRVVVDTAPTGHTVRLLESGAIIDSWVDEGRAMAEKAGGVSAALVGRAVPLRTVPLLDEWRAAAQRFNTHVIGNSSAVVVTRAGEVVHAETLRLMDELQQHGMRVAATIAVADGDADFTVEWYSNALGCAGLREWRHHVSQSTSRNRIKSHSHSSHSSHSSSNAKVWIDNLPARLIW